METNNNIFSFEGFLRDLFLESEDYQLAEDAQQGFEAWMAMKSSGDIIELGNQFGIKLGEIVDHEISKVDERYNKSIR